MLTEFNPNTNDEAPIYLGRAIVVMGVSGSGKTTLGAQLAMALGAEFFDADEYHDAMSVEKMRAGIPLSDEDRAPWLLRLNELLRSRANDPQRTVLACSALKADYRDAILCGVADAKLVFLHGAFDIISKRIRERSAMTSHYMPEALLQSQFDTLEAPTDAIMIDVALPPEAQLRCVLASLSESQS